MTEPRDINLSGSVLDRAYQMANAATTGRLNVPASEVVGLAQVFALLAIEEQLRRIADASAPRPSTSAGDPQ